MMMIWALGHSIWRLLRLGYGWDVGGLGELVVTIDFIMYTDFNSIKQKLQVISHCLVPISLANWRYEKDTFLSSWKRNVLTVQIISPPVRFDLSPSSILSHLHLWFISTGSYIGNTSTHAHTHTPSFHLLCSACEGPAVTNQASNDACMGWNGGGGVMEVERNMERLREPSSTPSTVKKKKRSISRLQSMSLYMCCCEETHEGQSMKEMMCERAAVEGYSGGDCVQDGTEMYCGWIMSQHLASTWVWHTLVSISQMDYLPNGPWQSSFRWEALSGFKHLSLRRNWTLLMSLCLLSKQVSLPPTLDPICLCCPYLSSISTSPGIKWQREKQCSGEGEIQIGYISFPLSLFRVLQKSQVICFR